jgi:hypothetical protein
MKVVVLGLGFLALGGSAKPVHVSIVGTRPAAVAGKPWSVRASTTVAMADGDIGPVAAAENGDLYYATSTRVFRLAGGAGSPVLVAARESKAAGETAALP